MPVIHFLNVKEGDCSWIQHGSGNITVIDVFNATEDKEEEILEKTSTANDFVSDSIGSIRGNYNQKDYPVNPIRYLKDFGISSVFRFILTHPDLDHMGGIKALFSEFEVQNFWDTDNTKEITSFNGPYKKEDWDFYIELRNGSESSPKRLTLLDGSKGKYYNKGQDESSGGDGLYILSPTQELIDASNKSGDFNDCSYVILYRTHSKKILFSGDSGDKTWEHLLENHSDEISDIDILFAPHHGRNSNGSYEFLDKCKPKITYFGNANSEHLAYDQWNNRNLIFITNNQANCIVTDITKDGIQIYVTNETFARNVNSNTQYSRKFKAWSLQ